jgi:hypothetical protein
VSEVWLSTEEVCRLTGEIKETVRRKCKCGKYVSTFTMECRNKIYSILLSSLPQKAQDKYFAPKEEHNIEKITANLESYANAPDWAKKQADKYLELISLTKDMTHSEIEAFLNEWNKQHPEKSSSYTRLYLAKREYEKFGISALLSKKQLSGRKRHIPEEYFKYYKDLYLNEGKTVSILLLVDHIRLCKMPRNYKRNNISLMANF